MICWGFNRFSHLAKKKQKLEQSEKVLKLQKLPVLSIQILSEVLLKPRLQVLMITLNLVVKQDAEAPANLDKKAKIMLSKMAM